MGPRSQATKDKISATKKRLGQRPNPSVVDLEKARAVRWSKHTKDHIGTLLVIYQGSAKRRGVLFDISRTDFENLINLPCFYCGDPPKERTLTSHRAKLVCNGIDRVDNSLGYVAGNCVTACKTCNVAKARLGQQEFINHCKKIAARHDDIRAKDV